MTDLNDCTRTLILQDGTPYRYCSLPALATTFPRVARLPVSMRIVLNRCCATWTASASPPSMSRSSPIGNLQRSAARKFPSWWRASYCGLHRRALAVRPRRDAQCRRRPRPRAQNASNRWCRSIWWSITRAGRSLRHPASAAPEHGDRVPRNRERYEFLKWGMQAFDTFKVVPPGIGIVHQVNLEHLFQGIRSNGGCCFQTPWSERTPIPP